MPSDGFPELDRKFEKLESLIGEYKSLAIAFSGGVDSSFLAAAAKGVLGDRVLAVTSKSMSMPMRELEEAQEFCQAHSIEHVVVEGKEFDIEGFKNNPVDRCYLCKTAVLSTIIEVAAGKGCDAVAEGSNASDASAYRPGSKAVAELRVVSPLQLAGLTKAEVREMSRRMGLPTWNKQSFACLNTRFEYGALLSAERLSMVDRAEQFLMDNGFRQVRVRVHGDIARIEIPQDDIGKIVGAHIRNAVCQTLRELGFKQVTLDLVGYRTGSMDE